MPENQAPSSGLPVVGVGASAGGFEAFAQLLHALPEQTGMAFVLVQHLDPRHDSKLADLLGKTTRMPVVEATQDLALEPDHVYVIAPDTALTLADGALQVAPRTQAPGPHLPIDRFFRSLAARRLSLAIGVVLSGTGTDGTAGLEEIKAAGGITFAQDDASAKFAGMPLSAVGSGCVDLVLPPTEIAAELARIGRDPNFVSADAEQRDALPDEEGDAVHFRAVLTLLRLANGVDFSAYRDTTIKRRIRRRLMLHGGALATYAERLRNDRAELDALYQDILINVTRFFREPEVFESLKQRVFPELLAAKTNGAPIRIWVPGCSTGQEAYSIGIALLEFLDDKPVHPAIQIFATDLSESVSLQKARAGLYPDSIEAELSPERLRRFFQREDSHYRVNKGLREIVVFARQNVAADPPFSHVDLVSCRNLLIYLSPLLQKRVVPTFHYALNPGGYLLLGGSETIGSHTDLFAVIDQPHRIYARRSTGAARPYPHFRSEDVQLRQTNLHETTVPPRGPVAADWQREADRLASKQYVPPGVLINEDFDILQFRGKTGPFLAPAAGEPSTNLLKMAREGLFVAVRAAVVQVQRSGEAVRQRGLRVREEGIDREVDLHVMPIRLPHAGERCYLVLFEEVQRQQHATSEKATDEPPPRDGAGESNDLRQELASTREYLESLIEQQDAANEELKSANEEILSSNEELQSTNEELETAKEELQSVNEELHTVNEQLQYRNKELGSLNDDMTNLIASTTVIAIVLGIDLRIRRFTPAAGKLLGLLAGDIGRPLLHLNVGLNLTAMDTLIGEVIATVQPQERALVGPDGRAYQLRIHPYRTTDNRIDGAVLVLFDVDELKRAQTGLRDERDYAQAVIETVREPLLVLDAQLRVELANEAFYATFQVTSAQTRGHLVYELGNHQWDIPALREKLGEVLSLDRDFTDFEVRHEFVSIGYKVMRLWARRIRRTGPSSDLILLAIEDRTHAAELEDEAQTHLEQMVEDDRNKTAFLALLAHELRNPLAPIRNALYILGHPNVTGEIAQRMHGTIERQLQQLTRLVDDLLDIARITKGRIQLRKERVELGALVSAAIDAARPSSEAKGIELRATLPEAPIAVDVDAARLSQALGNLLSNAVKFTDPGGQINVALARNHEAATIRIRDTGIGIPAEQLPRVFDMFMQGDSSLERREMGLGLGLTLVKQLVDAHGGTVSASSKGVGRGSEFSLQLPLPEASPTLVERAVAVGSAERTAKSAPRRRILIVDDNHDGAQSLALALGFEGHEVRTAFDGPAAIALAAAWQPDVVLLDIGLPGMNGYEVARHMGGQHHRRGMRLIAISGWAQEQDRIRSADAGFDAHLVKPVDFAVLTKLLNFESGASAKRDPV